MYIIYKLLFYFIILNFKSLGTRQSVNELSIPEPIIPLGKYPALVFISPANSQTSRVCAGSLISLQIVVSDFKCLAGLKALNGDRVYEVIGGDISYVRTVDSPVTSRKLLAKWMYSYIEESGKECNVSLKFPAFIKLLAPIIPNANFRPIQISRQLPNKYSVCTVLGIDKENIDLKFMKKRKGILHEVDVFIVPFNICFPGDEVIGKNVDSVICAESLETNLINIEKGDSGQLICNDELAGISSCGSHYKEKDTPCVYMSVSSFTKILENEKTYNVKRAFKLVEAIKNVCSKLQITSKWFINIYLVRFFSRKKL